MNDFNDYTDVTDSMSDAEKTEFRADMDDQACIECGCWEHDNRDCWDCGGQGR